MKKFMKFETKKMPRKDRDWVSGGVLFPADQSIVSSAVELGR